MNNYGSVTGDSGFQRGIVQQFEAICSSRAPPMPYKTKTCCFPKSLKKNSSHFRENVLSSGKRHETESGSFSIFDVLAGG